MMNATERAAAIRHYRTVTAQIKRYEKEVHFGRREYVTDLQLAKREAATLNAQWNLDNRNK